MMPRAVLLIALIILLTVGAAACAPADPTPLPAVPTAALIPATDTATPTDTPPTQTPADLPAPGDVVPTHTATAEVGDALLSEDVIAAELVGIAQRQVAAELGISERRVQVVEVVPVVWTDSSLNCPLPDQQITAMEIDGYRIVLEAGTREYVFHADFDRVLPCDLANEVMPTAEVTAEATEQ